MLLKKGLFLDSQLSRKKTLHNPEFAPKHIENSTIVLADLKFDWLQIKSLRKVSALPATHFRLRRRKSPNCTVLCVVSYFMFPFYFRRSFQLQV